MAKAKTKQKDAHAWRRLERALQTEQQCHFCGKMILAGTEDVWIFNSPTTKTYMCPGEKMGACVFLSEREKKAKRLKEAKKE